MNVDKAIFGQVGHGHGLRNFSSKESIFRKASQWLDLPDSLPSSVNFSPYISGFKLEDQYIIAKTFLDENASRSGMVVSYAIAVPTDQIRYLSNLNQLLKLLPNTPVNDDIFCDGCVTLNSTNNPTESNIVLSNDAVELLVSRKAGPIIHIGFSGFEELVASLWQKLWPSMRKDFSFRLSLSPRDCIEPNLPSLVCVPESLVSRWNSNCKIIGKVQKSESLSKVANAFLYGYESYNDFCISFGIKLIKPSMLELVVQAYDMHSRNLLEPQFDSCLSLIRLLEQLSPNSVEGSVEKERLVIQLENLISGIDIDEILKLRNISGRGFGSLKILWNAVELKLKSCHFYSQNDDSMIKIVSNSFEKEKAVDNWRQSVQAGFIQTFNSQTSLIYAAVWRWLNLDFGTTEQLLSLIEITLPIENLLKDNVPDRISKETEELMLPFFANNNLLQLHGLVLALRYSTLEAFSKQLQVDKDESFIKGLEEIAKKADPLELLSACLSINDQRITKITVANAVEDLSILKDINFSSKNSLSIWAKVLPINPHAWSAPKKPQEILFSLLDEYVTLGKSSHIELLRLLSMTPISDLCEFPKRSGIWSLLDNDVRENYLSQTALGWYERALNQNFIDLDNELDKAVSKLPNLTEKITQAELDTTKTILEIFKRVTSLSESNFLIWLNRWIDNTRRQPNSNMITVGQLIQDRNWKDAASLAFRKYKTSSPNAKTILIPCRDLLPLWDRFTIGFHTSDYKWETLTELAQDLYPFGPEENNIWVRSGGRNGGILNNRTGSEAWEYAIRKMRNGAKPLANDLVDKIKSDFPNNDKVEVLEKLFKD